ncbi:MAG: metallophosphoesterase [Chlorobiaceae bacterium]|nr:metallophosphoesterase [Chlorobiaceae bacterium]NTV61517.1 metallophosphoesterase [Chlorobiaceae bacterium]
MRHQRRKHLHLKRLFHNAVKVNLDQTSRVVILSDLHMGNGGIHDEFRANAPLVKAMLQSCYLPGKFSLVLNGDIEELFKFPLESITSRWAEMFDLFLEFRQNGFFWKTYGNHDAVLPSRESYPLAESMADAVRFSYGDDNLLVFHGHQVSVHLWEQYSLLNKTVVFLLRYLAKPAGIKNFSVAYNNRKQFAIEKTIYDFSNRQRIVSIIGHTHRPLFESLSKVDYLNYRIEELCRAYPSLDEEKRARTKQRIGELKAELSACSAKAKRKRLGGGIYDEITIPSVFNSGCTIGKRGITAIEIDSGTIRLVYWYNGKQNRRFISERDNSPTKLGSTAFSKIVLNEDSLDYIFSRINLLA